MSKELVKKEAMEVAPFSLEESDGEGFEGLDSSCFIVPRLKVLQKGSPQCDCDKPEFIESARPGMWLLTTTGEVFDGEKDGITITPALATAMYKEWKRRDEGGGFIGSYPLSDPLISSVRETRDKSGNYWLDNGHYLQETHDHYVIFHHPNGIPMPAIISMKSSHLPASRDLNSKGKQPVPLGDGRFNLKPKKEFRVFSLRTKSKSSDQYTWKILLVNEIRLSDAKNPMDKLAVPMADRFREDLDKGLAQVIEDDDAPTAVSSDF